MNKGIIRFKKCLGLAIIFFTTVLLMPKALADDGVLGVTPDGVYPVAQSDIMMTAEDINIKMTEGTNAFVTCRFDFKNFGEAQTVLMGFPASLNEVPEGLNESQTIDQLSIRNFTAKCEKEEIPVDLSGSIPDPPLKQGGGLEKYSKWYTFSVDFGANEEKTLYHTYEVSFSHDSIGEVFIGYVLETGALWMGPIGHAKVVFDMGGNPMYSLTGAYPNNYFRIEGSKLIWERSNFEPQYNLEVVINQYHFSEEYLKSAEENGEGTEFADAEEKIHLFQTPPEVIRENSEEFYGKYAQLMHENPVSALYIKSALELPDTAEKPEITGLKILEHNGGYWYMDVCGTDPDGDLLGATAAIGGTAGYRLNLDPGGRMYYDTSDREYHYSFIIDTGESKALWATFTITDAAGNTDSETMTLQTPEPEPPSPSSVPEPSPAESIKPSPAANSAEDNDKNGMPAGRIVENTDKSGKVPSILLIMLITALALGLVITIIHKGKNKKC